MPMAFSICEPFFCRFSINVKMRTVSDNLSCQENVNRPQIICGTTESMWPEWSSSSHGRLRMHAIVIYVILLLQKFRWRQNVVILISIEKCTRRITCQYKRLEWCTLQNSSEVQVGWFVSNALVKRHPLSNCLTVLYVHFENRFIMWRHIAFSCQWGCICNGDSWSRYKWWRPCCREVRWTWILCWEKIFWATWQWRILLCNRQ